MKHKLRTCLVAGVVGASVALASPAMARGGGFGGGHGGGFGGMHGGGGMHAMGGGMHFGGGMGGARFGGAHFGGPRFAHAAFSPRFAHTAFHRPFFHHRFHHRRFAFIGAPYLYASYYDGCWRRVWGAYGPHWVNVCASYGYYGY